MINRAHNFQIQSVRIPLTFYSSTIFAPPSARRNFLSPPLPSLLEILDPPLVGMDRKVGQALGVDRKVGQDLVVE
jgi:hypothetical protein